MTTTNYWALRAQSGPLDRVAARVVMKGEPDPRRNRNADMLHSVTPMAVRAPKRAERMNPSFSDLTGVKFGRFQVIGIADTTASSHGAMLWVCRCACGDYELRRAKAIRNPQNIDDCCVMCRQVNYMRNRRSSR